MVTAPTPAAYIAVRQTTSHKGGNSPNRGVATRCTITSSHPRAPARAPRRTHKPARRARAVRAPSAQHSAGHRKCGRTCPGPAPPTPNVWTMRQRATVHPLDYSLSLGPFMTRQLDDHRFVVLRQLARALSNVSIRFASRIDNLFASHDVRSWTLQGLGIVSRQLCRHTATGYGRSPHSLDRHVRSLCGIKGVRRDTSGGVTGIHASRVV